MGVAIILVARTISHMQVNNIDLQVVYSLFYFSRNMCLDLHKKYVPWSVTKISFNHILTESQNVSRAEMPTAGTPVHTPAYEAGRGPSLFILVLIIKKSFSTYF